MCVCVGGYSESRGYERREARRMANGERKGRDKQQREVKTEKDKRRKERGTYNTEIRGDGKYIYNNLMANIKVVTTEVDCSNSYLQLSPMSRIPGFDPREEAAGQ